jgi:hypothetical protein
MYVKEGIVIGTLTPGEPGPIAAALTGNPVNELIFWGWCAAMGVLVRLEGDCGIISGLALAAASVGVLIPCNGVLALAAASVWGPYGITPAGVSDRAVKPSDAVILCECKGGQRSCN